LQETTAIAYYIHDAQHGPNYSRFIVNSSILNASGYCMDLRSESNEIVE